MQPDTHMEVPRILIVIFLKKAHRGEALFCQTQIAITFQKRTNRGGSFSCNSSAAKTCLTATLTFPLLVAAAEASSSREASRSVTAAAAAGAEAAEAMAEDVFSLLLAIDKLACD